VLLLVPDLQPEVLRVLAGGPMQHTGKWWEVYQGLTADECLESIRDEGIFTP
jgi:hypothetical protein